MTETTTLPVAQHACNCTANGGTCNCGDSCTCGK
jgi:hypothetical protein